MWKFAPASDSDGHPLLRSLNNNAGRQVWVYDENAGTPEERKAVEEAQTKFRANRFHQKDSADELLRCGFLGVVNDDARYTSVMKYILEIVAAMGSLSRVQISKDCFFFFKQKNQSRLFLALNFLTTFPSKFLNNTGCKLPINVSLVPFP